MITDKIEIEFKGILEDKNIKMNIENSSFFLKNLIRHNGNKKDS